MTRNGACRFSVGQASFNLESGGLSVQGMLSIETVPMTMEVPNHEKHCARTVWTRPVLCKYFVDCSAGETT